MNSIVRIGFAPGEHVYGRGLTHPYLAVYDLRHSDATTELELVVNSPLLFVVAVHDSSLRAWPVVGTVPPGAPDIEVPRYFMQDRFNPAKCQIIDADGQSRAATPEECVGLERAAVWEAEHVEQRIRDHYKGVANAHLESMKLRL